MTDDEFLRAFFDLTLPHSAFHHRDHLRLAWLVARRHGSAAAPGIVGVGIRRYATAHGHGERYHDTMTRFWVRLVGHAVDQDPALDDFDVFLAAYPLLLDQGLPFRHWTREVLLGPEARASWTDPDRLAIPF